MSPYRNPNRNRGEVTPSQALQWLKDGNKRYLSDSVHSGYYTNAHIALIESHMPVAAVLACADARVGAELIFDQEPGDLFMVRLAGNFVSDHGLASMEYAVEVLGVPLLLVLGHTHCGAVSSAIKVVENNLAVPGRIFVLIDALEPSVLRARMSNPDDLADATARENVRRQVRRLRTISPLVHSAIEAGRTDVAGAMYDMATGAVEFLDTD
jgi:carbonic anhydrase